MPTYANPPYSPNIPLLQNFSGGRDRTSRSQVEKDKRRREGKRREEERRILQPPRQKQEKQSERESENQHNSISMRISRARERECGKETKRDRSKDSQRKERQTNKKRGSEEQRTKNEVTEAKQHTCSVGRHQLDFGWILGKLQTAPQLLTVRTNKSTLRVCCDALSTADHNKREAWVPGVAARQRMPAKENKEHTHTTHRREGEKERIRE